MSLIVFRHKVIAVQESDEMIHVRYFAYRLHTIIVLARISLVEIG